ncbi:MAG: hypothetical protein ABIX01_17775 [Chitinophagaceae bacterium]
MKFSILIAGFTLMLPGILHAQTVVHGRTVDLTTGNIIALATVTNLNKGKSVVSSYSGRFTILAEAGNLLVTSYSGYDFDTVRVTPEMINDTINIKMNVLGTLLPTATVIANSKFSHYQLDSMERRLQHAALLNKKNLKAIDGPVEGSGFGISFSLDRYSKHEKQKRRAKELFEMMEEEAYINYRFPNSKVTQFTGLTGEGLVEFLNLYRPNYDWLRKHTVDEDVVDYINSKIKTYRNIPGNKLKG